MSNLRIRLPLILAILMLAALPVLAERPAERDAVRAEAVKQYDALAPLGSDERKDAYIFQSVELQSELWVVHLERFLAAHPDLTAAQRAVIYEGLGALRAGLFARLRAQDPAEVFRANEDLTRLINHSTEVLTVELARQAFFQLGPNAPAPAANGSARWNVSANLAPYCACSTRISDCAQGLCFAIDRCRPTPACGGMFQTACDGLCY